VGLTPDPADLSAPTPEQAQVVAKVKERFPQAVRGDRCFRGQLSVWIDTAAIVEVLRFLRTDTDLLFDFLTDITAVDRWQEREAGQPRFEVIYNIYSLLHNQRLLLKVWTDDGQTVPSATAVWTGANFMEREVYDLMGVVFAGHPNLERILTPEGWLGHPLRKDHPTRSDQFPNVES